MILKTELDLSDVVDAFEQVGDHLERNLKTALKLSADLVAGQAKAEHIYTDRSHVLTDSIAAGEPTGSLRGGDLDVEVGAGAPYALFVEEDTKPHPIEPKKKKWLRWPVEGGFAFAKKVQHPGTTGTHFLANALDAKTAEIEQVVGDAVELSFLESGLQSS